MIQPETQFATVGNDRVAYQLVGEGPRDLVYTTGFWSHLDIEWEDPGMARFFRRLASFSRLIRFDRRGTGLSDRPSDAGSSEVEHWLQDCAAVLDAVGSTAATIVGLGSTEIGGLALQFLDRHPHRCSGLVLVNGTACWAAKPGYPEGLTPEAIQELKDFTLRNFGTVEYATRFSPRQANSESFARWLAKLHRSIASPRTLVENMDTWLRLDCRALLPRIRVPTLVIARGRFLYVPIAQTRYLAEHIPGARYVELPDPDARAAGKPRDALHELIEEFVTGRRHGGETERTVATVLFTDIVDSTQRAAQLGDAAWRHILDRHDQLVRQQVSLHRGRFIESSGDGTLATFESPSRAIDCALALHEATRPLGLSLRAGLHTGEVELRDNGRVGGLAVHFGARVMATAQPGEVLVSHTVHGILMGSRHSFAERGIYELKGVPGTWPLYAVQG
jgi:class 3 adenylate cyclase